MSDHKLPGDSPSKPARKRPNAEDRKILREWVRPGDRVGKLLGMKLSGFMPSFTFCDIEDPNRVLQLPPWLVHRLDTAYKDVKPLRLPKPKRHSAKSAYSRFKDYWAVASWMAALGVNNEKEDEGKV